MTNIQSLFLPLHPSGLVCLLFLQHLSDPGVDKEKADELVIRVQKCIIHTNKCLIVHPASRRSRGTWLSRGPGWSLSNQTGRKLQK